VTHAETILSKLDALERKLALAGFPPMSKWWRDELTRFYRSGKRRFVVRGGRRSGKSTSVIRVLVLEALYGHHKITPGDVGIVGIVSVSRGEATARLRLVKAILDALGVRYTEKGETVELATKPIVFAVMTASRSGVVGGTWIGALFDEAAYWRDSETGSNPATEVLGEARPTMATCPEAREFLVSAPLGLEDAHAKAFDEGETDGQCVAWCPSWVGNPTLTPALCAALEPDAKRRARLYGAVPQAGLSSAFESDHIERAFAPRVWPATSIPCAPIVVIDASSGRADAWTWGVARWRVPSYSSKYAMRKVYLGAQRWGWEFVLDAEGNKVEIPEEERTRPTLVVEGVAGLEGKFGASIRADQIVKRVANDARSWGATRVVGDQRESYSLSALFAQERTHFTSIAWTGPNKEESVATLRRWMREGDLVLPVHETLKKQLANFAEKVSPSGALTYGGRQSTHDDYAALLLTLAMADADGLVSGSPLASRFVRSTPDGHVA
jgi:hypothetical protein